MVAKNHTLSLHAAMFTNIFGNLLMLLCIMSSNVAIIAALPIALPFNDKGMSSDPLLAGLPEYDATGNVFLPLPLTTPTAAAESIASDLVTEGLIFQGKAIVARDSKLNDIEAADNSMGFQYSSLEIKNSNVQGLTKKTTPGRSSPGKIHSRLYKRGKAPSIKDLKEPMIALGCLLGIAIVLPTFFGYCYYNWRNRNFTKPLRSFLYHSLYCCACCYCSCFRPNKRRRKREAQEAALALCREARENDTSENIRREVQQEATQEAARQIGSIEREVHIRQSLREEGGTAERRSREEEEWHDAASSALAVRTSRAITISPSSFSVPRPVHSINSFQAATASRPMGSTQTLSDVHSPPIRGESISEDRSAGSSASTLRSNSPPVYDELEAAPPDYSRHYIDEVFVQPAI